MLSLQFLCLKNIRTFLASCNTAFAMKKSDLFEAFDLFDVRDFGKVRPTPVFLSSLSGHRHSANSLWFQLFNQQQHTHPVLKQNV